MRLIGLVALLALGLGLAGRAGGAGPPAQLFVTAYDTRPGAVAETEVDLRLAGPTSVVSVDVPAGYGLDGSAPSGTVVGTVTTCAAGGARATATLLTAEPGTHAAVWSGGTSSVLVDPVAGGGYRLALGLPAGTVDVDLDLDGALTNPPLTGPATWRALVTRTDGSRAEARSVVGIPQTLGLRASFVGRLILRGRLRSGGRPRPRVDVHFAVATRPDLSDARDVGSARTRADGSYALTRPFPRGRVARPLTVIAYVNFYAAGCAGCAAQSTAPPPAELVSLTIPGR
jgi:hypothetical protein